MQRIEHLCEATTYATGVAIVSSGTQPACAEAGTPSSSKCPGKTMYKKGHGAWEWNTSTSKPECNNSILSADGGTCTDGTGAKVGSAMPMYYCQ